MATLKDVADKAGVTVTTVSRMLNNRCNISPKTRANIEAAMKDLGYQPNELARSLAKGGNNMIGLIIPTARSYFFSTVIERIEYYAAKAGCKLMLCISQMRKDKEHEYYNMLMGNKVKGIVIWNLGEDMKDYPSINAPIMVMEQQPHTDIPCALTDNYAGGRLAAEHLIQKGCRNLLYFGGTSDKTTDTVRRYDSFRDTALQAGLTAPVLCELPWEDLLNYRYDEAVEKLFREHPETDGIMTLNEPMAAAIIRYCLRHEIKVPEQIKVVAYDDTPLSLNSMLQMTVIHQPVDEICRYAVDSLIQMSAGKTVPTSAVFPVHLIQRETT